MAAIFVAFFASAAFSVFFLSGFTAAVGPATTAVGPTKPSLLTAECEQSVVANNDNASRVKAGKARKKKRNKNFVSDLENVPESYPNNR